MRGEALGEALSIGSAHFLRVAGSGSRGGARDRARAHLEEHAAAEVHVLAREQHDAAAHIGDEYAEGIVVAIEEDRLIPRSF